MSLPEPAPDSVALVTGASSGIGEQFAHQLSEMGHRVALVARREDRLRRLAEDLGGADRAVAIGADLAAAEDRDRLGERPLLVGGLLLQGAGFLWVALEARAGLPYSSMIAPLILAGTGVSSAIPAVRNSVMSAVAPGEIGKASGTFSMMRQLGGAFGLAIAVSGSLSLLGAVAGAWVPARRGAVTAAPLETAA